MANRIANIVITSHAGASRGVAGIARGNASGSHRGHGSGSADGVGSSLGSHHGHGSGSAHGAGSSFGSHRGHGRQVQSPSGDGDGDDAAWGIENTKHACLNMTRRLDVPKHMLPLQTRGLMGRDCPNVPCVNCTVKGHGSLMCPNLDSSRPPSEPKKWK
ncbi:hypothetical protein Tco_0500732 [Tanacetum coccineum]